MDSEHDSNVDYSKVVPLIDMKGDDDDDTAILNEMANEAHNYLVGHAWCANITESYFGFGVGGLVAVFLFRIVPVEDRIDDEIWVIVGDIPPLYISTDNAPNPACALDGYMGAMEEWAEAVLLGRSTDNLPPMSADATPENGKELKKRLEFIDKNILIHYQNDLL